MTNIRGLHGGLTFSGVEWFVYILRPTYSHLACQFVGCGNKNVDLKFIFLFLSASIWMLGSSISNFRKENRYILLPYWTYCSLFIFLYCTCNKVTRMSRVLPNIPSCFLWLSIRYTFCMGRLHHWRHVLFPWWKQIVDQMYTLLKMCSHWTEWTWPIWNDDCK